MPTPKQVARRRTWRIGGVVLVALLGLVGWEASVGQKTLMWAVDKDHVTIARVLLALRLDPNGDPEEPAPLCKAAACKPELVRLLLRRGANPNRGGRSSPSHGGSVHKVPLQAVDEKCGSAEDIVEQLAAAGADFRSCPPDGRALLASSGIATTRLMLKHGADPNQSCQESAGRTPLHYHADEPDVIALLLDHGAKIVEDDMDRWTPLHVAVSLGRKEYGPPPGRLKSAELLLAHGADVNALDKDGLAPLDLAYENGDKEMAAILIKHGGKAQKHESLAAGEAVRDTENEYRELYAVAEGVRKGPACSLSMHGDNHAVMEEGPNWSIIQGTVGVVRVNCHAGGYFHYAVLGMGSPVPKRLNMPLSSGPTTERITFDKPWSNGMMHFYYSAEPIKNLVRAIDRGDATHFAVRYVNVGK